MSHDIRTPMNAIIGYTSLAAAHADNKEQVCDYLKKIQISGSHLLSLINDVLDMSRIESGKFKIDEKEVHLPDVIHDLRIIQTADAPTGYAGYEFRIKDNGIGMSEEFQAHIFEAFTRERTSTVSGIQGTGLGMSITKNIVDMMGGP